MFNVVEDIKIERSFMIIENWWNFGIIRSLLRKISFFKLFMQFVQSWKIAHKDSI